MGTHVVVCAALVERDGEYLLVEEGKERARGEWNLPAGSLDPDEDPAEGARREAREETGLTVTPTHLVGVYHRSPGETVHTRTTFVYAAADEGGTPEPQPDDSVRDVAWVAPDDLTDRDVRAPYVTAAVRDHREGRRYPADLTTLL